MDPYFSSLAREVLYLHSLWYLGPPRNFNPNPNNNGNNNHINLRPCNPPIFKKESQKKNRRGGRSSRRGNKNAPIPEDGWPTEPIRRPEFAPVSEVEWPTEPIPEPEVGWPDSVRQTDSSFTRPVSAEEQENFKAFQLQNQALNASKNFFSRKFGSDSEDENFMEDVVDDDDDDDDDESEVFKFFLNLYTEDSELRNYFEKDYFEKKRQGGVFFCLVCGVRKKKLVKRYNNSVALVQHTASNSNTKQKTAHRAFGQVLCRVLGVEFNRLPKLVLSAGGPLFSDVSAQADEVGNEETGNKVVDSVNAEIAGGDQRKEVNGIAVNYAAGDVNGNSADCETGMKENDANNQRRGLDKEAEDYMGGNSEKIIDFNNSRKDGAGQQDQDIPKKIVNSVWEKLMKDGAGTQKQDLQKEVVNSCGKS